MQVQVSGTANEIHSILALTECRLRMPRHATDAINMTYKSRQFNKTNQLEVRDTYRVMCGLVCRRERPTVLCCPPNYQSQVFCYWARTALVRWVARHQFGIQVQRSSIISQLLVGELFRTHLRVAHFHFRKYLLPDVEDPFQ